LSIEERVAAEPNCDWTHPPFCAGGNLPYKRQILISSAAHCQPVWARQHPDTNTAETAKILQYIPFVDRRLFTGESL
jgi:hypothetical protein